MSGTCVRGLGALALSAAVLLLSACQVRLGLDVRIDRDGGGELAVTFAADRELAARAQAAGVDPVGEVAAAGEALAARGWRTNTRLQDGHTVVTLRRAFGSPAELEALTRELAAGLSAPEVKPLEPLQLTVEPDRLVLQGAASLVPTTAVENAGLLAADAVAVLRRHDAVDYQVTVTFPGEVLEASGAVQEQTVRWRVQPGERHALAAVAVRPRPARWPFLVAGGLVLVLAGTVVLRQRRSRRRLARERLPD